MVLGTPEIECVKEQGAEKNCKILAQYGGTDHGDQVTQMAKFCMMVPNICGSSVLNLCHIIFLGSRILRWLIDIWKTCTPLSYNTYRCQCKDI
jgi:hypothetical protein